jgi:DHA1 family tetracycline resistance protein-like MFS transporter
MSEDVDLRNHIQTRLGLSPIFIVLMTIFVDMTGFAVIIVLLPFYAAIFQEGPTALGILVASCSVIQIRLSPILGRISDNVGRRPILLLSILISSVSFILFALADSFIMLLLSRIIAGIATETAVAQAYIADITSKKERATGMGRVSAAQGAGFIIGPAIGGFLSVYGFWAPGLGAATLAFLNFLFVFFFLPESTGHMHRTVQIASNSHGSDLRKLKNALSKPLIGSLLAILFIMSLAFSAMPVILPLLGISFFGLGTVEMAYFFTYIGLVQIALQGLIIGKLAKMFGEEKLMASGSLLMMFGIFFMALFPNIAIFLALATIMILGSGMIRTVVPSLISKRTPVNEQGGMLGVTHSVSSIARVPGPLIGGFVSEFAGLVAPFFLSAILLVIAFVLAIRVHFQVR